MQETPVTYEQYQVLKEFESVWTIFDTSQTVVVGQDVLSRLNELHRELFGTAHNLFCPECVADMLRNLYPRLFCKITEEPAAPQPPAPRERPEDPTVTTRTVLTKGANQPEQAKEAPKKTEATGLKVKASASMEELNKRLGK